MTILEKIKLSLYKRHLAKAHGMAKKVDHHSVDFDKAKTIGILFDANDIASREIVQKYTSLLERSGKTITQLGFLDEKTQQANFTFPHFSRKEINWIHRPASSEVQQFIEQPFDVLLNLYTRPTLSLEYIAVLSKATFRVGPVSDNTDCYDLMVQTDEQKDLRHFIQQVEFFLKKMNLKHEASAI